MSEAFTVLTGIAAPLPRDNVDTDLIWPAGPGISVQRGKQAWNAFATLRYDSEGNSRPDFILNQPPYDDARILVSGRNFGCGSSREMAVWALHEWGLRCIIAPSFGDIFYNNACINGLLPVALPVAAVDCLMLLASDPATATVTVDLTQQRVSAHGFEATFDISAHRRACLLQGLDEIAFTLGLMPKIAAFGEGYSATYPWTVQ